MSGTHKVSTCLWFDRDGEAAAKHYVSLIEGSRIVSILRYGKDAPMPEGTAMMVEFELAGTPYIALNGGPHFKLDEAASIVVKCSSQEEIDRLWGALLAGGGREQRCGWLTDRFGLSWQIVPARLGELLQDPDGARAARAFTALMGMVKLDIARLEAAHRGE